MQIRYGDSSDPGWKKLVHWIICIDLATNTSFHMQKKFMSSVASHFLVIFVSSLLASWKPFRKYFPQKLSNDLELSNGGAIDPSWK